MSRPTVAMCMAKIENQNLYIATLEDRIKKLENAMFQRTAKPATKPVTKVSKNSRFVSLAHLAPDACKHFNVRSVTRQQLQEYASTL